MASLVKIKGMKSLIDGIRRASSDIGKETEKGVKRAAAFLEKRSREEVPVDQGNLKASSFTRTEGKGFDTTARVGYTANYAVYVHENLQALHGEKYNQAYGGKGKKNRRSGQKAKFLEDPARNYMSEIAKIIAGEI